MISRNETVFAAVGLAVAIGLGACGDATRTDGPSDYETAQQEVRVVPKFEVDGTHNFPENVRFDDLGLSVASIKLTPVDNHAKVAYSSSAPESVTFDVGNGGIERRGRELVLPEAGKFDVTLRLEPVAQDSGEEANSESPSYSLALSGYIAGVSDSEGASGGAQDGQPIPMPVTPDEYGENGSNSNGASDRTATPKSWMPFKYTTRESVHYTLDEVEFTPGRQVLSFRFDAEDWANEIAEPIERAIRDKTRTGAGHAYQGGAVDVTRAVDSKGEGSKSLEEHVSVQAMPSGGTGGGGL